MRVRQMFQFPVVLDPRWLLMWRLLLRRMVSVISPVQLWTSDGAVVARCRIRAGHLFMRWKASQSLIRIATILPGMLRWSRQRVVPPVGVLHPSVEGRRPRSAVPHVILLHGIVGVDPAPIKPTGHHVRPVVAGMVASLCPWGPQRVGARPLLDIGQAVEPGLSPGFLDRSHLDAIVQTVPWSHNPRLLQ